MEAREPEQQAMMEKTTKAQRVGLVLISKSNFISGGDKGDLVKSSKSSLQ